MPAVVLFQPEIPPNTGNIIRLCANTGVALHLVHPLGFSLSDKAVKRAGLDYHGLAVVRQHVSIEEARTALPGARWLAFSTRGKTRYSDVAYEEADVLLFGPETRGLPDAVLETIPEARRLYLPMAAGSRSLNLSNAVAIAVYEALRQLGFRELS